MKHYDANKFGVAMFGFVFVLLFGSSMAQANPVTLDWVSSGNNPEGYYYVSPYTAEVKNTGQLITLYCIDFNHEVAPPWEWEANIQPLNSADVPSLQYGNLSNAWIGYEQAAWLISQLTQSSSPYQQAVDQYAAWKIFLAPGNASNFTNSEGAVGGSFASDVTHAYNNAVNAIANGYTPSGWSVVSPDPDQQPSSTQEFLTPGGGYSPVATPEPVSFVLLGTALLGLAAITRWRLKRRAEGTQQP